MERKYLIIGGFVLLLVLLFIGLRLGFTGNAVSQTQACDFLYNSINDNSGLNCTQSGYDAVADIDKDGEITFLDLVLLDDANNDSEWCFAQLSNDTNPCAVPEIPAGCPDGQTNCSDGVCRASCGGNNGNNNHNNDGTVGCTPSWQCSWGDCANNVQRKNCVDSNGCGSTTGKPAAESRVCGEDETTGLCSDGETLCSDGSCKANCNSNGSSAVWIWIIVALVLIIILVVILIRLLRKNPNVPVSPVVQLDNHFKDKKGK